METKTFKELIEMGVTEVYLRSYGYTQLSCLGSTWQPFGNKARFVKFKINREDDFTYLSNKTFWPEEDPKPEDMFTKYTDYWISNQDYDLECR